MSRYTGLVCPRCRRVERGRLVAHELQPGAEALVCPGCGARHPLLQGIPVVLRDLETWRASQPEPAPPGALAPPGGSLPARVRELVAALPGPLLDLGCGTGALCGRADVTGLDARLEPLRAHPGRALVGDAHDPPFRAGAFASVLLLNLLDACREPLLVLQQADALLAPGGALLLTTPWTWSDAVTPPDQRLDGDELAAILQGRPNRTGLRLDHALERREDELTWRLHTGPRLVHEYRCELFLSRKPAGAQRS